MDRHNLVAVYKSRDDAERALDDLLRFGIPAENMRLSAAGESTAAAAAAAELPRERHESFWDWLIGNVPEQDRNWYGANLREGMTALSVLIDSEAQHDRVADILERFDPVDINDEAARPGSMVQPGIGGSGLAAAGVARAGERRPEAPELTREGEQVIPVVKEELDVGKRVAERRYRIRTYTVERPVEEQVRLRDERVVVERRPATGEMAADPDALRDREFEVVERHEEAVVEKRARPVEEVVVRREANDRVETVRGTVRETKVDVDKEPVEHRVDVGGTMPPNRKP